MGSSVVDVEAVERICSGIANGTPAYRACEIEGLDMRTFFGWLEKDAGLMEEYEHAQRVDAARTFGLLTELADRAVDRVEELDPTDRRSNAIASVHRLRIDTLKWALGKKDQRRYGDHQRLEHAGSIDLNSLLKEADGAADG